MKSGNKILDLWSITCGETIQKNYLTKKASQPCGNLVVKKKNWFQEKKHENYLKCKNDVKKLLGAFNQELWAISGFLKSG